MPIIQTTQLNIPEHVIDFGAGQPSLSLLPREIMARAAAHRLGQDDASLLQYGANSGDGYFRVALAQFLSEGYKMAVDPDYLFITSAASQALDAICQHFTRPGDTIFIEEPTYFLALFIFQDYPLNIVSIPVDEDGLIIEALEVQLSKHRPAFLYTIPTFHNPSAVTLSAARREALVRLSEAYGFLVVADEVYHLLDYTSPPPPPLASYDRAGTVLSVGSFSKILAPGLRLGWIQAKPRLFEPLLESGLVRSGGGLNPFTSGLVRSVLELGLQEEYLQYLKAVYGHRAAILSKALRHYLPTAVFAEPQGGFFIWLRFPDSTDTEALLAEAEAHDVAFKPGSSFSNEGGLKNYLRLSFAYYEAEKLTEGVRRLAQVMT